MKKELTPQEKADQELADQIKPLIEERFALDMKRGNGVTLEKNEYIGERLRDIEQELGQLKTKKTDDK